MRPPSAVCLIRAGLSESDIKKVEYALAATQGKDPFVEEQLMEPSLVEAVVLKQVCWVLLAWVCAVLSGIRAAASIL